MKFLAGFIGIGNMGGALLDAVLRSTEPNKINIFDTNTEKCAEKSANTGVIISDIKTLANESKFVFLGVKPNIIKFVAEDIKNSLNEDTVVVSMAAGIDSDMLCGLLNTDKIIRIMPNTPVSVGEGMILYTTQKGVTNQELETFLNLISKAGRNDFIEEKFIDAAAALSGCGPAFVYMFAEALADGAVKCGLSREKALLYAKQTIYGSGAMMLNTEKHPGQLKDDVCSPGGTTIEGVLALEDGSFRHTVASAVSAAYNKTAKLKK